MPTITCPCGYRHDMTPMPDDGWKTVRDRDYETVLEKEDVFREGKEGHLEALKFLTQSVARLYNGLIASA